MPSRLIRRLYDRGSSCEVTIPAPILYDLDLDSFDYEVVFRYDSDREQWYIDFERVSED